MEVLAFDESCIGGTGNSESNLEVGFRGDSFGKEEVFAFSVSAM